jgi:sialidase-1
LAFAEARLPCVRSCGKSTSWGDSSPKHIAFRRSTDGGASWSPTEFIVRSDGTNDNLNLGNVVLDERAGAVLLQWGGCVHCSCTGTTPKPKPGKCADTSTANVKQLRSTDYGDSWAPVEDISSQVLDPKLSPIFKLGEGSGVQLKTGSSEGELVVCGRISSLGPGGCPTASVSGGAAGNCGSACILSSDGGVHWTRGGAVPSTPTFGGSECEPVLLNNGSILLNMRSGNARLLGRSDDSGRSFVDVHPARDLEPIANCQGSTAAVSDGTLLFTAPAGGTARRNLSLAVSHDSGSSWNYVQSVHSGASAYSALAPTTGSCAALLFEGAADPEAKPYAHIYYTTVCATQLKSDDDATATLMLEAGAGGSWSHPGWWAHCREPSPYCLDKNHCLCLPPLPKRMRSYQMNLSTVTYFIGNASGMDSPTELQAEARFGNVGVGWQIDGIPKHWAQGLEVVELAEAKRLKARRPDVRVLVSRQSEVGTKMWNTVAALVASDPTNARKYFTSCRGKPCAVKWEANDSFFFNWANPALRDWWVHTYIGGALNESAIDGVYLGTWGRSSLVWACHARLNLRKLVCRLCLPAAGGRPPARLLPSRCSAGRGRRHRARHEARQEHPDVESRWRHRARTGRRRVRQGRPQRHRSGERHTLHLPAELPRDGRPGEGDGGGLRQHYREFSARAWGVGAPRVPTDSIAR